MALVRFDDVSLEFGDIPLLTHAAFHLDPDERVALLGRNGAGKTSLLKLVTGELTPDHGEIQYKQHLRISMLRQTLPHELDLSAGALVMQGLAAQQALIEQHRTLAAKNPSQQNIRDLEKLQNRIEAGAGWKLEQQCDQIISVLGIPAERTLSELSGGWQRRVALARALVSRPELLLLDEPTNHLDIATIEWLEQEVRRFNGCTLFVTHDRNFMQQLATRIVEIDRGKLISWPGSYHGFLRQKANAIVQEDRHNALFDKKLKQEEAWIRQGVKARRTRNEGRVRALHDMREQAAQRIQRQNHAHMVVENAERSGRKVIEAHKLSHAFSDQLLLDQFSLKIMRGDRIGIIGNNGVGKSTLLKLLLGEITPSSGTIKLGTNLKTAYFDQLRREIDDTKTIAEFVGDGRDYIKLIDKERHIIGYLKGFLFSHKRAVTPISALSGGERNRVILAKLFTRPINLLVLDEPTNDLDIEMLEVLEQKLIEYQGTLLVVSHDRMFLDNVVTSTLVFEEKAGIQHYPGGYSDWLRRGRHLAEQDKPDRRTAKTTPARKPKTTTKLSYKLQRELDQIPSKIEALEQELSKLQAQASHPEAYADGGVQIKLVLAQLSHTQQAIDTLMNRWAELEERKS